MSTYSNLGTVSDWQKKQSILEGGRQRTGRLFISDDCANSLKTNNATHGRFLYDSLQILEDADNMINNANIEYDSMLNAVDNAIRLVAKCEENGEVTNDDLESQYIAKKTQNSFLGSSVIDDKISRTSAKNITDVPVSSLASNVTDTIGVSAAASIASIPTSSLASNVTDTIGVSAAASIASIPTSSLASNIMDKQSTSSSKSVEKIANSTIGESVLSFSKTPNAFGEHSIGNNTWNSLTLAEQSNVTEKLSQVGYMAEEISLITSGSASAPTLMVNSISNKLEKEIMNHPEIKNGILEKYGFNIFNENGTIDKDKLTLLLVIDNKNETDEYDIIQYFKEKYDIDIVDSEMFQEAEKELLKIMEEETDIREELLQRYGFDIINDDKNISKNKLLLALLMDAENNKDEFDLMAFLKKYLEKEKKNRKKYLKGIKTLSGVNLLGVTPLGASLLFKEKEE